MNARPVVAVFAGFDGTGGAGLIADNCAITGCGGLSVSVATVVTAQNLDGIQACWPLPAARVRAQFSALGNAPVAAIKIGVCGNSAAVIVDGIRHWRAPAVWDPVLSPTFGAAFVDEERRTKLVRQLMPHTAIITPNRRELAALSGRRRLFDGVAALLDAGARHVLVTDGKKGSEVRHVLYDRNRQLIWEAAIRRRRADYHGSGCFFSATLAARLAGGDTPAQAAAIANRRTLAAIDGAISIPALGWQKLLSPATGAAQRRRQ